MHQVIAESIKYLNEEYQDVAKRRNPEQLLEEVCHQVAWNAV